MRIIKLVVLGIVFLYAIVNAESIGKGLGIALEIPPVVKFLLAVFGMHLLGKEVAKETKSKEEMGMVMLRSRKGIMLMNKLAKHKKFWEWFADSGLVIAYGLLGSLLIKEEKIKKTILGMMVLGFMVFFISPEALPFLMEKLGNEKMAVGKEFSWMGMISMVVILFTGFGGAAFLSVVGYGAVVLVKVVEALFGSGVFKNIQPGATLLLPGINIPFWEGIIALLVILVVHEGAHGILARLGRVRILSSGVVLMGIVPIGAFVEPDEKHLETIEKKKKTRVLVAGSTANFYTAVVAFLLFTLFLIITNDFAEKGVRIQIENESIVAYKINSIDAIEFLKEPEWGVWVIETRGATVTKNVDRVVVMGIIRDYKHPALSFLFNALGMIFSLNFIVGVINLVPLPLFDGHAIVETNMKNKGILKAITTLTIAGFLMNLLPWLF